MKHILSARQFSRGEVDRLIALAEKERIDFWPHHVRKVMAALFYEPSTRTRLSFESAMHRLGGGVISTENAAQFSSAAKGETLEDTIRVVSMYADVIVLRHPQKGAAAVAAECSSVPIISAGDGDGEHPTQALLDLYTVHSEKRQVDGLRFALVGDLRFGRTIHSLIYLLGLYANVELTLVSPPGLGLPDDVMASAVGKGMGVNVTSSLDEALASGPDVVYLTRVQAERNAESEVTPYIFGRREMGALRPDAIVMHPLPRLEELSPEVDGDPRAAYFRQAGNGLWMRAALLRELLA